MLIAGHWIRGKDSSAKPAESQSYGVNDLETTIWQVFSNGARLQAANTPTVGTIQTETSPKLAVFNCPTVSRYAIPQGHLFGKQNSAHNWHTARYYVESEIGNFRIARDPGEIPKNGQGYQAEDEYLRYARQCLIDHPYP